MASNIQGNTSGKIHCTNYNDNSSRNCNDTDKTAMLAESSLTETHITKLICLGLLGAGIIFANSVVLLLYKRKQLLKTKSNLCLVCLAFSDFLAGFIAVPMVIVCSTVRSHTVCTVMDLSSRFISISTVLNLLLVTMERYLKIIYALRYPSIVTTSRLIILLVFVWCFALGATLIQVIWIPFVGPETEEIFAEDAIYTLSIFFGVVVPSLLIMFAALICIFRVIRRQLRSMKENNGYETRAYKNRSTRLEAKAVTLLGSMIITFIACWFPYYILSILEDLDLLIPHLPEWAITVFAFLRFGSSILNPLIYTFFKEDFRRELMSAIRGSSHYPSTDL
ncbi:histamine H2 receptor-like [Montipora capricornis]|uniref:histamine H2 receptor-like n=1 Tax=Montipora capricornis TaxID=246305 RepID=UPI0035F13C4E